MADREDFKAAWANYLKSSLATNRAMKELAVSMDKLQAKLGESPRTAAESLEGSAMAVTALRTVAGKYAAVATLLEAQATALEQTSSLAVQIMEQADDAR